MVDDTRNGERRLHSLSSLGLELLQALRTKGLGVRLLVDAVPAGEDAIAAELSHLSELGLLLEEDGRFLSLVVGCRGSAI